MSTTSEGGAAAAQVFAPRLSTLLSLAWPIVVARSTQAFVSVTDAYMTSPLGQDSLAAVTTGALDLMLFVMLPMGTVFILQSYTSQLRGRGDLSGARRFAGYGLLISLGAGLLAAAASPFIETVLGWLDYSPAVCTLMADYLRIRLLSITAIVGVEAFGNWYGGLGNTRISLVAGVTTMLANIVGNYALIEPRFGLPGYGVAGAAWASTGASWLAFAIVGLMYSRGIGHDLPPGRMSFRAEEFRNVLRFGLPSGCNWLLEFGAFAVFINVVVASLGTTVLAAFNVVLSINMVSFMPAFGAASAGAILVGESIGAKRFEHVPTAVRLTLISTCVWMAVIGAAYMIFPQPLIGMFASNDADSDALVRAGAVMLGLCGLWQLFDAAAMTYAEALRAAGDTSWPMMARLLLAWGLFIPSASAAVFSFGGGIGAIMACLIGYLALLGLLLWLRFRSGRWRTIELVRGG